MIFLSHHPPHHRNHAELHPGSRDVVVTCGTESRRLCANVWQKSCILWVTRYSHALLKENIFRKDCSEIMSPISQSSKLNPHHHQQEEVLQQDCRVIKKRSVPRFWGRNKISFSFVEDQTNSRSESSTTLHLYLQKDKSSSSLQQTKQELATVNASKRSLLAAEPLSYKP